MSKKTFFIFVVICFAVIGILPILFMLVKSMNVDGRFSIFFYKKLMSSGREWTLIGNSFTLSFLTALFTTIIGLPLGILFAKTDLPFKKLFTVLFTVPLLVPPYITAVSWFNLLGREGLLSRILSPEMMGLISNRLFGLPGCVMILFSTFLPIVILLTITYLKTVNPRLEEAGRLVSGWTGVLKGITIPMIMPGILLASILVFLLSLGEFGVPTFLRYDVFPVESFTQFSAFYNFGAATAATVPLIIITFIVLTIERIFLRDKTYQLRSAADGLKSSKINLGIYRKWFLAIVTLLCICIVILPFMVLLFHSFSINVYKEAFDKAGDSLFRSIAYAAIGASMLTIIGFFLGYLIHSKIFRFWHAIDSLTIFLFALSGTVIGIGLINLWNRPATNFIYATPVIIILGYLAQYTALTSRITVSTLAQIPPSMEEAAQVSGAKWMRRITLITAPMAKRGLIAGWLEG